MTELVLAVFVLLFWIGLALDPVRRWPAELRLRDQNRRRGEGCDGATARGAERVAALVPARDEVELIERSVGSLLGQELRGVVDLRVFVVDDGSTDGTAARVASLHVPDGIALRVVAAEDRPEGWSGKVWAQRCGLEALRAEERAEGRPPVEWLLLSDADIEHPPDSFAALLALARQERLDLVSVMARLHAGSLWEKLLVPPFVFFFQLLYPFRAVRASQSRVAAAAGGCVLLRRATFERAGSFEAVRSALIDDVALARSIQMAGGALWLGFDPEVASIRRYDTLASLWSMIARNAFVQLRQSWLLLALVVVGLAVFFVGPPLLLLFALVDFGSPTPVRLWSGVAAALAWSLQAVLLLPSVRHHRVSWPWALTLPVSSALYGAMTVSSALGHLRGHASRWKGRTYASGHHRP